MWSYDPRFIIEEKAAVGAMTLASYVIRLFFGALGAIALLLACLFNLIEFFEKLARVTHVSSGHIGHFFYLNAIPSFFDVLPASVWLATIFVLRILTTSDAWDFLQFIGFVPRRLVWLISLSALVLLCGVVVMREVFVLPLAQRAEQFKYVQFKQQRQHYVMNSWFELEDRRFCFVDAYDLVKNTGDGLMLIAMTADFEVKEVTRAAHCEGDRQRGILRLTNALSVDVLGQATERFPTKEYSSAWFFNVICLRQQIYGLQGCLQQLVLAQYLPTTTVRVLWKQAAEHVVYYASLLWYPVITILLFCFGFVWGGRWLWVGLPYPITVACGITVKWAIDGDWGPFACLLLIVFLFVFLSRRLWQ
jgi:hypothetical protein